MTGLAIPSHSRRLSRLAVLALTLLAAGSFMLGLTRQIGAGGPSPFPTAQGAPGARALDAIPDATPAPALQVAVNEPPTRRPAAAAPPDVTADLPESPAAAPAEPVAAPGAPPAADASATAPDAPPPAPDANTPPTA